MPATIRSTARFFPAVCAVMAMTIGVIPRISLGEAAASAAAASAPAVPLQLVGRVAPIFSQLLYFHAPVAFQPAFENTHDDDYIQESVLQGESVGAWTEMLTVTGLRNVVAKQPEATPKQLAAVIASGFAKACPGSYVQKSLHDGKMYGVDDFVMVVSCGTSPTTGGKTSETAAIAVLKGQKDFYTLQWAERAAPSATPLDIDLALWSARVKTLMPWKLCPIVAGEAAPYPSCTGS
jgi:hypothetical protein